MRICQIIEPTTGGSIRVALDLSRWYADHGDDVTLLYSPLRADPSFFERIAKDHRVVFKPFPILNYISLHDFWAVVQLVRFLAKTGPYDVLHAHSSKAGGIARLAGFFFPRMAKVYSPHAFYTMSPNSPRFYGIVERLLSWVTDRVIAVSAHEKEHGANDIGIAPEKLSVVPNAVQPFNPGSREDARTKMEVGPNDFVLGFVGRLVEQKNVSRLIQAFARALQQNDGLRLVILGDGSCKADLDTAIAACGVSGRIVQLGFQDARAYYIGFDALVCSSDYEGFSLVFLESLYAGTPIVTTPVGGAAEAVINGKTGFVASDFTAEGLAKAIVDVGALSPQEREAMRLASRQHSQRFSLDEMAHATRKVYEECVAKRRQ